MRSRRDCEIGRFGGVTQRRKYFLKAIFLRAFALLREALFHSSSGTRFDAGTGAYPAPTAAGSETTGARRAWRLRAHLITGASIQRQLATPAATASTVEAAKYTVKPSRCTPAAASNC